MAQPAHHEQGSSGDRPVIRFQRTNGAYGAFSNFAAYPVELDGRVWPTTEHFFQAQKFAGTPHEEEIRRAPTPAQARRMGRQRRRGLRGDWQGVKEQLMYRAVVAKFTQHEDLRALLLGTGDAELVEHAPWDAYWGDGGDGTGRNRLGHTLMRVRAELSQSD
jgi:ribA/ribD-fused uncharacterized protein